MESAVALSRMKERSVCHREHYDHAAATACRKAGQPIRAIGDQYKDSDRRYIGDDK